jgi:hypothetical protein
MVKPEAVAKYSPLALDKVFRPAGKVSLLADLLAEEEVVVVEAVDGVALVEVVDGAEGADAVEEVDEVELVEVVDLVVVDSEAFMASCLAGAGVVVEDLVASLAIAGAAANTAITNSAKNFFMLNSVWKKNLVETRFVVVPRICG